MLVLKLCGNQRVDGVGRLRFDVRTGLKADEAEWKKRDVHTRHETATLEIGKAVAWHYAPVGKPGELWFRFGVIVCVEINQCVGCTRQFFTKSFPRR